MAACNNPELINSSGKKVKLESEFSPMGEIQLDSGFPIFNVHTSTSQCFTMVNAQWQKNVITDRRIDNRIPYTKF